MSTPWRTTAAVEHVLARAAEVNASSGGVVTVESLVRALVDVNPSAAGEMASLLDTGLYSRLGRTNQLLGALNVRFQEAITAMATVADLKTAADTLAANEAALATEVGSLTNSVEALVVVVDQLRASGSLSPADQQTLDSAVQEVTDSSAALAGETQNLAREQANADAAANPPPPPAPQG